MNSHRIANSIQAAAGWAARGAGAAFAASGPLTMNADKKQEIPGEGGA